MSDVLWRRKKPDHDGVVWNDLLDPSRKGWVVTYREAGSIWLVLYRNNSNDPDKYIDKDTMTEEQLRNELKLKYLLTRGEANNVR